ncbi:hypothetical protein RDI58_019055 [Solanum bulbocastanum]|uniref:Uncharacterized protein n=1 Tax=Solanum bulbocastanum TaxID=147425 RepID=A0AAN8TD47_SOLBU
MDMPFGCFPNDPIFTGGNMLRTLHRGVSGGGRLSDSSNRIPFQYFFQIILSPNIISDAVLPSMRTLFHASENLDLGLFGGDYDRNCGPSVRQTCLVLLLLITKFHVTWHTEKDVIWHANINITARKVLYSGSLTKRVG